VKNVTTKVPLYAVRIKTAQEHRGFALLLDKDGNTCDNGSSSLPMEFNTRTYLVFLLLVALWCGGIVLAPSLSTTLPGVSTFLYSFYSPICHQIDARSFHLFGEKLSVCSRCSSIYFGFLLSVALYPFFRDIRVPAFPKRHWIALAVLPMLIDVLMNFAGVHESALLTRAVTGLAFGLILPFYLIPPLLEGIAQLRDQHIARGGFFYARKTQ
jgi:uncharacterized membrane protein